MIHLDNNKGLILVHSAKDPQSLIEKWQFLNYQKFINHPQNTLQALAWLNFEMEEFE